jgi:hypothetical protein
MDKKIVFSKNINFYLKCDNHVFWHFRIHIILNVNNLFDFNIFKKSLKHTYDDLGININITETDPNTIDKTDIFFMYKKYENKLIMICSHKYYDGRLISYIFKILCENYKKVMNVFITDNQLTDNQLTDNQLTDNQLTDNQLTDNQLTDELKNNSVFNLPFIKNIIININNFTDNNTLIAYNICFNRPRTHNIYDYNPYNFNTITFAEHIQNTTKKNIILIVNVIQILEEPENIFGTYVYELLIKYGENVRDKVKSLNKHTVLSQNSVVDYIINRLDLDFIVINSLKNTYLPCFINDIEPTDFLYNRLNFGKQLYFLILPTDKEGKTLVSFS